MNTYDIVTELYALRTLIETDSFDVNEETGEVFDNSKVLQELSDELNVAKEDKADGIAYIMKEFKDAEKLLQDEIKRLQDRKAMMKRKQDSLKELLDYLLKGEKLKTNKFTFYYANSSKVVIEDEGAIPEQFLRVEYKIDKTEIGKQLKDFKEVAGATLEITNSLRIK